MDETVLCNCENATGDCDHGKGVELRPCTRNAGRGRVDWLGPVCDQCCRVYESYGDGHVVVSVDGTVREG